MAGCMTRSQQLSLATCRSLPRHTKKISTISNSQPLPMHHSCIVANKFIQSNPYEESSFDNRLAGQGGTHLQDNHVPQRLVSARCSCCIPPCISWGAHASINHQELRAPLLPGVHADSGVTKPWQEDPWIRNCSEHRLPAAGCHLIPINKAGAARLRVQAITWQV